MAEVASYRIHDSTFMVATVDHAPATARHRASWGTGILPPDWKTFHGLLRLLRRKGFAVGPDPQVDRFPSLSKYHRLVSAATPHGTLYAFCEATPNGCSFEFFQEVATVNRNGGRYDFDKRARMPYLIRKKFEGALRSMIAHLQARGFVADVRVGTPVRSMPIGHRLAVAEGRASALSEAEIDAAALAYFDAHWDGEYERRRGTHRFRRGEDGWPVESELGAYGRRDRDGAVIRQGERRLFRDHRGHLLRGRVSGGIGGQWTVVYGPGKGDVTHRSSFELFSGDPRTMRRRDKAPKPLKRVLEEAVAGQDFERAIVLRDLIAKKAAAATATIAEAA